MKKSFLVFVSMVIGFIGLLSALGYSWGSVGGYQTEEFFPTACTGTPYAWPWTNCEKAFSFDGQYAFAQIPSYIAAAGVWKNFPIGPLPEICEVAADSPPVITVRARSPTYPNAKIRLEVSYNGGQTWSIIGGIQPFSPFWGTYSRIAPLPPSSSTFDNDNNFQVKAVCYTTGSQPVECDLDYVKTKVTLYCEV